MFYIFNKNNVCIGSCSEQPDKDDLESRNEFYKKYNYEIDIGSIYTSKGIVTVEEPSEVISARARFLRDKCRKLLDVYLMPASTYHNEMVSSAQKDILVKDSLLLARWPSTEGWPYVKFPDISPFACEILGDLILWKY